MTTFLELSESQEAPARVHYCQVCGMAIYSKPSDLPSCCNSPQCDGAATVWDVRYPEFVRCGRTIAAGQRNGWQWTEDAIQAEQSRRAGDPHLAADEALREAGLLVMRTVLRNGGKSWTHSRAVYRDMRQRRAQVDQPDQVAEPLELEYCELEQAA